MVPNFWVYTIGIILKILLIEYSWAMKKGPLGCLGYCWGWNPTQLYRDYKDPVINQPVALLANVSMCPAN